MKSFFKYSPFFTLAMVLISTGMIGLLVRFLGFSSSGLDLFARRPFLDMTTLMIIAAIFLIPSTAGAIFSLSLYSKDHDYFLKRKMAAGMLLFPVALVSALILIKGVQVMLIGFQINQWKQNNKTRGHVLERMVVFQYSIFGLMEHERPPVDLKKKKNEILITTRITHGEEFIGRLRLHPLAVGADPVETIQKLVLGNLQTIETDDGKLEIFEGRSENFKQFIGDEYKQWTMSRLWIQRYLESDLKDFVHDPNMFLATDLFFVMSSKVPGSILEIAAAPRVPDLPFTGPVDLVESQTKFVPWTNTVKFPWQ